MFSFLSGLGLMGLLTQLVKIIATAFEVISPLLKLVLELIVDWVKILWDGTKTILSSWKAIAVVATLMGGAYLYDKADDVRKNYVHNKEIKQCKDENQKLKTYDFKTKKRMPSSQTSNPWNPLEWRF